MVQDSSASQSVAQKVADLVANFEQKNIVTRFGSKISQPKEPTATQEVSAFEERDDAQIKEMTEQVSDLLLPREEDAFDKIMTRIEDVTCHSGYINADQFLNNEHDTLDEVFEGLEDLPNSAPESLKIQQEKLASLVSDGVALVTKQHEHAMKIRLQEEDGDFDKVMTRLQTYVGCVDNEDTFDRVAIKGLHGFLHQ